MKSEISIVNEHLKFPQVSLKEPAQSGFVLISAEVDKRTSFWKQSKAKTSLIEKIKSLSVQLRKIGNVVEVTLFKAALFPPGRDGGYLKKIDRNIHDKYDVVLLIELDSVSKIDDLESNETYKTAIDTFDSLSSYYFVYQAKNLKRIDFVDHKKNGVFLFNYFVAANQDQNLKIWEYTAGWFQDQTNLDNSMLLSSIDTEVNDYSVINHCRWDAFSNILPSLIFKRTLKTYVLANFEANDVAAIPILFKLA